MDKRTTVKRVTLAVCHIFAVDPADIATKLRNDAIINAKKAIAYILRRHYQFAAGEIVFYTSEPDVSVAQVYRRISNVTELLHSKQYLIFKELLNTSILLLGDDNFEQKVTDMSMKQDFVYKKKDFQYRKGTFKTQIIDRLEFKMLSRQELAARDNKLAPEKFYPYLVYLNF